jgi:site-specific DNA recombinase
MKKAAIYARFSSHLQSEESIDAQVRACREYAEQHDITILKIYQDEAISGKGSQTQARKQYQTLLRACDKGEYDIILIHKYNRIARSLNEHVTLEKRLAENNVELIAVAEDFGHSKQSKVMKAMMWALSEYYIDDLADETRKGLKETALKAKHNGGVAPFGYDIVNQKYVINEMESFYVQQMYDCAVNRRGYTELVQQMAARGVVGKRGKPIKYPQIYEILRNEKYTGTYAYSPVEEKDRALRRTKPNAIRIENALPEIISRAQFMEVQKIMDERKQVGNKANYLCSGLVYCKCGAKMHGITTHRKGHEYQSFYCSAHCGAPMIKMETVDGAAKKYLSELLSAENQKDIADALKVYISGKSDRTEMFKKQVKQKINEKQSKIDALMGNLSSGVLPAEVLTKIGEQIKELDGQIKALKEAEPPKDYTVPQIKAWLQSLKKAPDEKAIHLLIERIDIKNKTEVNITSTLTSVLGENGCGGSQHSLPTILFGFCYAL